MKIGIYKITSPSGKVYIGQSTNIDFRFASYRILNRCKRQTKLFTSFTKYGVKNHFFEIIEECEILSLNERERYWQEFYQVLDRNKGLNLRLTKLSDKAGKMSEEVKEKISKANIGRKHSEQFRKKCSDRLKGKRMSQAAIDASIKSRLGKKRDKTIVDRIIATKRANSKYIIHQYSLNDEFIKEWFCLAEIEEVLGFPKSNIHTCLTGKTKYSNGYKWKKINK